MKTIREIDLTPYCNITLAGVIKDFKDQYGNALRELFEIADNNPEIVFVLGNPKTFAFGEHAFERQKHCFDHFRNLKITADIKHIPESFLHDTKIEHLEICGTPAFRVVAFDRCPWLQDIKIMDKAIDLTPILPSDKNKTTYQIISPQVEKVSKYDTKYAKYVLKTEKPTIHIFNVDGQVLNFDGENKDIQEINIHSGVKQIVLHNIIACDKLSNAPTPYLPQLTLHNVGHKTEPSEWFNIDDNFKEINLIDCHNLDIISANPLQFAKNHISTINSSNIKLKSEYVLGGEDIELTKTDSHTAKKQK